MTVLRVVRGEGIDGFLNARRGVGIIFSALNMFMLGYLRSHHDLPERAYFWCDGVFATIFARAKGLRLSRLRGAEFTTRILQFHRNESISVLGSLSGDCRALLEGYGLTVSTHHALPTFDASQLSEISIDSQCAGVLLTLPSPMQEIAAVALAPRYPGKNFYCVGGALNMLAHPELDCPKLLQHLGLEFAYRLRTDTVRRVHRLLRSIAEAILNLGYLRRSRLDIVA